MRKSVKAGMIRLARTGLERAVRSGTGLVAGGLHVGAKLLVPKSVRDTQLYTRLVDGTFRILIETVGQVQGAFPEEGKLASDVIARKGVGNVVELLGFLSFRASPVWVLAGLADVAGIGRKIIPEIAAELKERGLLEQDGQFETMDQFLAGLERTSGRLARTVDMPPLDVASLRQEWEELRAAARGMRPDGLPSGDSIEGVWQGIRSEATRQNRSILETSTVLATSAVQRFPDGVRWVGASAVASASRTGRVLGAALLDDYRASLTELRKTGFLTYLQQQFEPYLEGARKQWKPSTRTTTDRLIDRFTTGREK